MSPGRCASPDGMFSTRPSTPTALTLALRSASALHQPGDHAGAAHVPLHVPHALAGLQRDAAGVEGDALADEGDRRLVLALAAGALPLQHHQLALARRALADAEQRAHAELAHLLLAQHLDLDAEIRQLLAPWRRSSPDRGCWPAPTPARGSGTRPGRPHRRGRRPSSPPRPRRSAPSGSSASASPRPSPWCGSARSARPAAGRRRRIRRPRPPAPWPARTMPSSWAVASIDPGLVQQRGDRAARPLQPDRVDLLRLAEAEQHDLVGADAGKAVQGQRLVTAALELRRGLQRPRQGALRPFVDRGGGRRENAVGEHAEHQGAGFHGSGRGEGDLHLVVFRAISDGRGQGGGTCKVTAGFTAVTGRKRSRRPAATP